MMVSGIYAIEQTQSGKVYIGSATNFAARWRVHLCLLRKGKHHSSHLQSAWDKYGEAAFVFKKLLVCAKEHLILYEQRCIDGFKSYEREFGFNARQEASSQLGMKHSDEAKAKIKAKRAAQVFTEAHRAAMSIERSTRKCSQSTREKMSASAKGKIISDETRQKLRIALTGRKLPIDVIEGRSITKLNKEKVITIRMMALDSSISQFDLARMYGVSQSAISNIVTRKRWGSV